MNNNNMGAPNCAQPHSTRAKYGNVEAALWRSGLDPREPADFASLSPSKCLYRGWCLIDRSGRSVHMDGMNTTFRFKRDARAFLASLTHVSR